MDESVIKRELVFDENISENTIIDSFIYDAGNPEDNETAQPGPDISQETKKLETGAFTRKKLKLEIELDYKLENEYYYKQRERRKVVKYEENPLPNEKHKKKKSIIKDRKNNEIRHKKESIKYKESEEQFVCSTCNLPFTTIRALICHRKKHCDVLKFICILCSEAFETNAELINHKLIHKTEDRNFLCMKCKMAFTDHLEYLKHKVIHRHFQPYKCIECGEDYNNKQGFLIHIETHFDRMIECEVCYRKLKANSMKSHMKTHTSKDYKCVECGKICGNKTKHEYHMISHTGVKPYQCLYCGKGFGNTSQRLVHTRTHTDERPYKCHVCHQKFKQCTDKIRHLASHKTEKTIQCDVCNKKFLHIESLSIHMDIHNNRQKYKCHVCDKRIHTKTGLIDHLARFHSEGRKFECVPCGVSFKTSRELAKHFKWKKHINNQYVYNRKMKVEK